MPRIFAAGSLARLLDQSTRPVYLIDEERRIAFCNSALASWMAIEPERIVGRAVEYHSEATEASSQTKAEPPLTDLCPLPRAFFGERCTGTISCMAPIGRLVHRRAEFVPLAVAASKTSRAGQAEPASAVLVLLADHDLTPQNLASQLSKVVGDPPADELHRTIRQFRRAQAAAYGMNSLLGTSAAMRKVRAQVAAAAVSGAHVLVVGPPGSGRGHVARAIHYQGPADALPKLVPFDCRALNDDRLRRALDGGLKGSAMPGIQRPTLLLENLECLAVPHQEQLLSMLRQKVVPVRVIATLKVDLPNRGGQDAQEIPQKQETVVTAATSRPPLEGHTVNAALLDALSTIAIQIPRLIDRTEDLPILAQSMLESCNRGSDKQIGSIRSESLDLLALYCWPRELDELREVIEAAHRACKSHEIAPEDLPPVIHHAAQSAARATRRVQRIVLDELLATIEKEVVSRALTQAGGNKSGAAELLGMTRPRLYRRMIQLGLISEPTSEDVPGPVFIERDAAE